MFQTDSETLLDRDLERSKSHHCRLDELTKTKRDALGLSGTGKAKKSSTTVVFAAGVFDTGARQLAGAAIVVDSRIEEHYKEMVRQICQTIRVADQFAEKK